MGQIARFGASELALISFPFQMARFIFLSPSNSFSILS